MLWERRGGVVYPSVEEAILSTSGQTVAELLHPSSYAPESVDGITEAGRIIFKARSEGRHVYIIGDYDADGITATAILSRLGCVVAIIGMFFSDICGDFFNGMDYGSACVLGIGMYLCVVVVTCTGIIVSKISSKPNEDTPEEKEE